LHIQIINMLINKSRIQSQYNGLQKKINYLRINTMKMVRDLLKNSKNEIPKEHIIN
jgi:hypothetical protein